jgi:hypothetical protein
METVTFGETSRLLPMRSLFSGVGGILLVQLWGYDQKA